MTRRIYRTTASQKDEAEILNYLREVNVGAGLAFMEALEKTFESITNLPDLGSPLESDKPRLAHVRYWQVRGFENYAVLYRRRDDDVLVLRVLHGSRNWDDII